MDQGDYIQGTSKASKKLYGGHVQDIAKFAASATKIMSNGFPILTCTVFMCYFRFTADLPLHVYEGYGEGYAHLREHLDSSLVDCDSKTYSYYIAGLYKGFPMILETVLPLSVIDKVLKFRLRLKPDFKHMQS